MNLTWIDPARIETRDLDGALSVYESARVEDNPHDLPRTVSSYVASLQHGWDGEPAEAAVTRDASGRVVGVLEVSLPRRDNLHLGYLEVTVDPLVRQQGVGRALYEAGVERIRSEGRTLVMIEGYDSVPSLAFAKAMGLDRAIESVKRRHDLRRVDTDRMDHEYEAAERAASGYELVRMPVPVPDEDLAATVDMVAAINDAPLDDLDFEDEVFTPERIRAFEAAQEAHGRRTYHLVARHGDSGVLVGHTMVGVESEFPWYAHQFDTSVLRDHRGHRLGLLLKIGMVRWLRDAEPGLQFVDTWNAASNDHMISVNETLGYQVVATATGFQRHL